MAVIKYKTCDICGSQITHLDSFHKMRHIIPAFNMDYPEHICGDCFIKMKEWIKAQKEGAKEDEP